jgi:O-antigen/teichoic acid export membrane protein
MSTAGGNAPVAVADTATTRRLVLKNTLYLTIAQVLTIPLSIVNNALAAHYLGPEAFGYAYLAFTLTGFAFLAVEWGHQQVLPAMIAKDPQVAGDVFISSMAWRSSTAIVISAALLLWARLLHYSAVFQWTLAITCLVTTLTSFVAACKDTIRGLERTDIPAIVHVGQQVLMVALVATVLVLGGDLIANLMAQAVAAVIVLLLLWPAMRRLGVTGMSVRWRNIQLLFQNGTPFVALGFTLALQPNIDAFFLSKLAPEEVMGWFAVARRLVGALLLPATALIGALYPTLCRLHVTDPEGFRRTTNDALRSVALVATPVALCCALFPEVAINLLGGHSFGPAAANLRAFALFIPLVYFSMPLAACITAAGKQRVWSIIQILCAAVCLVLDPLLIPLFQRRMGNGALGVCVAAVATEALTVAGGAMLVPHGVFDRKLGRVILLTLIAGVAMTIVAQLSRVATPFVAAPLSLIAYAGTLWWLGAVEPSQVAAIRSAIARRGRA